MKPYLHRIVQDAASPLEARNSVREYLQARILGVIQRAGAMVPLAFHGGTALRFLFAIARYSEDLDFALERREAGYDFRAYLRAIQSAFEAEGYELESKVNDRKVVHSAFVRFAGLLYELELSPHRNAVLAVKLEVDTRPPAGATLATSVVRRHTLLQLQHHDRASLLAGKLRAILQRPYPKGRDLYDLLWYLSDPAWPAPNLVLLNNALAQSGWDGAHLNSDTWRDAVRERLLAIEWKSAMDDVRPFLEDESELALLTPENVLRVLENPR